METYISSLAKNHKTDKDAKVIAQSKINSAIKQLHNVIDSFEEDKTTQRYATLEYDGKFTLVPFTVERMPQKPVEITAQIGNETIWLGTLSENGVVSIQMNDFTNTESGTATKITSQADYSGAVYWMNDMYDPDEVPADYYKDYTPVDYVDSYEVNGVRYKRTGQKTAINTMTIETYDFYSDYAHSDPYWHCTAVERWYERDTYTLDIDYSNGDMHIYQKYLTKDIA